MSNQAFSFTHLAKYLKPEASNDLNRFLETVPEHVGKAALIAAGVSWAMVMALGLYTMIQTKELSEIKSELSERVAVKPDVPIVKRNPVSTKSIEKFVKGIDEVYPGLEFRVNKNKVTVLAKSLQANALFREALRHMASSQRGWVASVDSLCVGRECKGDKLVAVISLDTISIE